MTKISKNLLIPVVLLSLLLASCGISSSVNQNIDNNPAATKQTQNMEILEKAGGFFNQIELDGFTGDLITNLLVLPDAKNTSILEGSIEYQSDYSLDEAYDFFQEEITKLGIDPEKVETIDGEGMFQFIFTDITGKKSLVLQSEKVDDSTIRVTLNIQ